MEGDIEIGQLWNSCLEKWG